jgi:predicted nuclease with TOPRIM domain
MTTFTIEQAREFGLTESQIASMEAKGFFAPVDPIEDRRDDLTSEIEEVESDLESWETELAELQEQISKGRVKLARLKLQLSELPPPAPEDEE